MTSGGTPGTEDRSDRDLLTAHLEGDPEAFAALFRRHRDRLWAVALRTTGSREDAADALQDAMVSAFRRADSYRGDASVTTWLHRVVVNACLDLLRRRQVRLAGPLPDDLDQRTRHATDAPALQPGRSLAVLGDPEAAAAQAETRALVHRALAALPPDQRVALVLVDMHGYAVAEAAEVLDCPTGTVKSRCARGRARLAELLRGEPAEGSTARNRPDPPPVRSTDEEVR